MASNSPTTYTYGCEHCGATDIKLWRAYNAFLDQMDLRCFACLPAEDRGVFDPDRPSKALTYSGPAVPDFHDYPNAIPAAGAPFTFSTCWGYTSVPLAGFKWWDALPVQGP